MTTLTLKVVPDAEVYGDANPEEVRAEVYEASKAGEIKRVEDDPESFKDEAAEVQTIVIPQSVYDSMTGDMGLTDDQIIAMFVKSMGRLG